ncbi:MAG: hypothetical protein V1814_00485 [Candidatus Moraniibacteriota bacterium]
MTNTLEKERANPEQIDEKVLGYIVLDVEKRLNWEKITPENPNYEQLVEIATRLILLKEKFGILKPGQPSSEKQEWFDRIRQEIIKPKTNEDWIVKSSRRHQLREERRAGKTYEESGLE